MQIQFTKRGRKDYNQLTKTLREQFKKQNRYLSADIHHPSVHAKKYSEENDIWQGRVNRDYRFYFRIEGDIYLIVRITKHPK